MTNVLGIEAMQTFLVEEMKRLLPDTPLAFCCALADKMCYQGKLTPISRFGQREAGPIQQASFEETVPVLRFACQKEKVDKMIRVSANVLFGQEPYFGTCYIKDESRVCKKNDE